jgi:hypothetical protein
MELEEEVDHRGARAGGGERDYRQGLRDFRFELLLILNWHAGTQKKTVERYVRSLLPRR